MIELERKPQHGQFFDVTIESVSRKGVGQAKLHVCIGPQRLERTYTVEVRKVLPGELVRIRVEAMRRRVITAAAEEILTPAPERIEPRCKHFGWRDIPGKGCGGCVLQAMDYQGQLNLKRSVVQECMRKAGLDQVEVAQVLPSRSPWYYRNKMEFSFGDDRQRRFALGFFPSGWHREVIALEECFLCSEYVSNLVPRVRQWFEDQGVEYFSSRRDEGFLRVFTVREGKRTGERMAELITTPDEEVKTVDGVKPAAEVVAAFAQALQEICVELGEPLTSLHWTQHVARRGERTRMETHHIAGQPVLHEELHLPRGHVLRFEIHPRAFFQPNTLQAEVLYGEVIRAAGLSEGSGARVLDLYCGTGTIGLCLAPYAAHVTGVELVPEGVENARHNAKLNGLDNVTFFAGDAGEVLAGPLADQQGKFDLVVVDPPRSGLMPQARKHIAALGAPRLVYVSCNPNTLARDLAELMADGHRLVSLQPVDMFPHTAHIENVALLERVSEP